MLASDRDTSSTDEGVIDEVTWFALALVRHKERKLVIRRCGSQVRPLLQVILAEIRVVIFTFARELGNPLARHLKTKVHLPILCILHDPK